VLCFGFGNPVPIVDVNVRRILGRYLGLAPNTKDDAYRRLAWALLPLDDPVGFNRALLDLGALVCTARDPRCEKCPITEGCAYLKNHEI
jgi:A/G-specific adenine glycosylase